MSKSNQTPTKTMRAMGFPPSAPPIIVTKLDNTITGDCACGDGLPAFAWSASNIPDGYVDACSAACARDHAEIEGAE
jgi:hypothetical protein